jgi:hypothetical protein
LNVEEYDISTPALRSCVMNRQARELKEELVLKLNETVSTMAKEKGITRQELLHTVGDCVKIPLPSKKN